ncbi:MAG: sulfotransferase [bacterium]|nr:sulfotransferase [bacterium]
MNEEIIKTLSSDLSAGNLMEMARRKTGLDDWGDEGFREPLEKLLTFFEEKYRGRADKKFSFGYAIIDILTKRLYVQDNFNSYPEIAGIPIERPLFIAGLPRTGTTLIHNLISSNPSWRVLLYWELLFPYNRTDIGVDFEKYAINLTEQGLKALYAKYPEFIKRHETKATGPEECFNLIKNTFESIAWANEWYLDNYLDWFLSRDMTDSYSYYRKLLQLLLWRKPGGPDARLLLKCPAHLFNVDFIFNVFPDAAVLWMHRDPVKSIASGFSLLSLFHKFTREDRFIQLYLQYFKKSLQKAMEIEKKGTNRLKSVSYKKLVREPVTVIRDIYQQFGYPWDNSKEEGILKWRAENPQHKHGAHKYSLEGFGLTAADIEKEFSQYYEEYGHLL